MAHFQSYMTNKRKGNNDGWQDIKREIAIFLHVLSAALATRLSHLCIQYQNITGTLLKFKRL